MRRENSFLLLIVIFTLLNPTLFPETRRIEERISSPSPRIKALGGKHAALADDFTTLLNNPAGFQEAGPVMSLSEITMGVSGPIFDIAGVAIEGSQGDIGSVITSPDVIALLQGLYSSMRVQGPISFGYVGRGLGFGFINNSNIVFSNNKPLTISVTAQEEIALCGGYSFRVPLPEKLLSKLDAGVLLKGFLRGETSIEKSFLQIPTLFTNFNTSLLTEEPFFVVTGIGFDVGIRYSFRDLIAFGIVGRDIFTPTLKSSYSNLTAFLENSETPAKTNGLIPLDLSAGVMFTPELGRLRGYIDRLKIMLDYNDILDFLTHTATSKHPILHIGLGIEAVILNILSLRAGMYQGLFSAGLGLDLTFFTLNASMFGSELSSEPGLNPVYNLEVGLEFRL